jgi:CRISPR-associated protein Cmr2
VPDIVYDNNGFLVYAGGDDVLAVLPLEDALNCAAKLRAHYCACFKDSGISTTISGAIEYVHMNMPLGKVLKDAHDLLDRIAKDGRGRDAIAARVWKPGGLTLEWAIPWEVVLENGRVDIQRLADEFQKQELDAKSFTNKFFFKIRERFDLLMGSVCLKAPLMWNRPGHCFGMVLYQPLGIRALQIFCPCCWVSLSQPTAFGLKCSRATAFSWCGS